MLSFIYGNINTCHGSIHGLKEYKLQTDVLHKRVLHKNVPHGIEHTENLKINQKELEHRIIKGCVV